MAEPQGRFRCGERGQERGWRVAGSLSPPGALVSHGSLPVSGCLWSPLQERGLSVVGSSDTPAGRRGRARCGRPLGWEVAAVVPQVLVPHRQVSGSHAGGVLRGGETRRCQSGPRPDSARGNPRKARETGRERQVYVLKLVHCFLVIRTFHGLSEDPSCSPPCAPAGVHP